MASDNKRFFEIGGGGVTTQTVAGTRTAGDNPNCVRLNPQLRKVARTLYASQKDSASGQFRNNKEEIFRLFVCDLRKNMYICISFQKQINGLY